MSAFFRPFSADHFSEERLEKLMSTPNFPFTFFDQWFRCFLYVRRTRLLINSFFPGKSFSKKLKFPLNPHQRARIWRHSCVCPLRLHEMFTYRQRIQVNTTTIDNTDTCRYILEGCCFWIRSRSTVTRKYRSTEVSYHSVLFEFLPKKWIFKPYWNKKWRTV